VTEEEVTDGRFTTPEAVPGCFQGTNWNLRPVCHVFACHAFAQGNEGNLMWRGMARGVLGDV
jgi:hypothetical protein